ncbi:TfoX/Sxy family protein [Sinanaerobacter sp. ZZT-01]|uniref:TfoX/Sxy family protein n=1 Tax=Sinanaerobacter sp. ZZT-01 TaxID=3111540 RepID=UPI002D779AE2|nr:TfoX/Sxy family protein [Sinanaerobacter sp. ZZT-01]WRR93289.1 TfoX/Sxy family protein [Sinanaerobacter sp. ZZT-01]
MRELSKLPNIGRIVEMQLENAGIKTIEELKAVGSKAAWLKIRETDPSACIHRLYGLEGAIRGIKKSSLPEDVKHDLRDFFESYQ